MWVITTAYDNVAQIYRLRSATDSVIIKGGQRGAKKKAERKWGVAEGGSTVGCHYERWFPYWIIHHTSAVCLLLFCVVMWINADKPRGNSDYYFQHITTREERWRRGKGKGSKAQHKESHMEHISTSTAVFLKIWGTEKWVGDGWRISGWFSDTTATKFTKFFGVWPSV